MNNKTWMLVADASRARIFCTHKASLFNGDGKKLEFVSEHSHPESRKTDNELVTDKPGKFHKGRFVDTIDPKQHEEEVFAIELANLLKKAHGENHYSDLILISPPEFMGLLNKHLSDQVAKLINLKIEKNYTQSTTNEIVERMQEYL